MRKNFKLILSIIIVLLTGALAFGQEKTKKQEKIEYKEVTLDGKPAKLNIATGEITFVNPNDKKKPVKFDDYVEASNTKAKDVKVSNSVSVSQPTIHTVKEGETLLKIAIRYGASLTELKRANNMETTLVRKGQKLRVSHFDTLDEETVVTPQSIYTTNVSNVEVHTVEKGQTLYSLAKRYGLTVDELKSKNNLSSNLIVVGQKLKVDKLNLVNSNTTKTVNQFSTWTVSKGETLYSIARENGVTVQHLKDMNGLTNNIILIGQNLRFNKNIGTVKK